MRVATLFTGVAAVAAVAPAAHAGTEPAQPSHQARPGATRSRIRPDIQLTSKCSTVPRWVHLRSSQGGSWCYGYAGFTTTYGINTVSICGGNNSGWLWNSYSSPTHFGRGTTWVHLPWKGVTHPNAISISKSYPGGTVRC
jgi:hypothetical protein